uniref:ShKT domain-containing protein n=1 Tax=Magallana gigas TaxID=29159 RepID=K1Q9Y7_MAGGI
MYFKSNSSLSAAVCRDKIDNCSQYGRSACTNYEPWARDNCLAYCGFCVGPPTTPVPCADKLDDCQSFGKQVCTEPKYAPWVLANCRYFCRQCTAPPACVNKLDNCPRYGQKACTNFKPWAQDNCRYYCRFCTPEQLLAADSKTTTTSTTTTTTIATPGIPCVDKLPHCDVYDDAMCTTYRPWAEENCRAYCLICTPSASSAEDSDDDIPQAELAQRLTPAGITFTDFVTADTDLIVTEEMTDDIHTESRLRFHKTNLREHMTEYELAEYLTTLLGFNGEGGSSELQEFDSSTAGDIIDQNLPVNVTEEMFANEILGFSMYKDVMATSQLTS